MVNDEIFDIKANEYNTPIKGFLKHKQKQRDYNKIYEQSKIRYYSKIGYKIVRRHIKNKFYQTLLSTISFSALFFILSEIGITDSLGSRLKIFGDRFFSNLKRLFKL